ncbi:MAG: Fe-S protein assembly co-chaperone HscB [Planctomycetota bacterium]
MSESTSPTRPTHCLDCSKPMESPICCTNCGALNPRPLGSINYFELFCIEARYDIDAEELHKKYLCLSRITHPDMAGRESDEMHGRALALNAELNRAYETLRNPIDRAEYLLSLSGGPSASEDKSAPAELLGEVMMFREEIEEALASGDESRLAGLKQEISSKQQIVLEQIGSLARDLNKGAPSQAQALREQLNTIKYWNNLADQLPLN